MFSSCQFMLAQSGVKFKSVRTVNLPWILLWWNCLWFILGRSPLKYTFLLFIFSRGLFASNYTETHYLEDGSVVAGSHNFMVCFFWVTFYPLSSIMFDTIKLLVCSKLQSSPLNTQYFECMKCLHTVMDVKMQRTVQSKKKKKLCARTETLNPQWTPHYWRNGSGVMPLANVSIC